MVACSMILHMLGNCTPHVRRACLRGMDSLHSTAVPRLVTTLTRSAAASCGAGRRGSLLQRPVGMGR